MSLATRCPACHTVFRVLQDQLRVSEGWVRCGQCQEVFNALETLFDLSAPAEAGAPANPPPAVFAPPPEAPAPYAPPPAAMVPAHAPTTPTVPPAATQPRPPTQPPVHTAASMAPRAPAPPSPRSSDAGPDTPSEPITDFAPTAPQTRRDPFDDIDTFTVIDAEEFLEPEGPVAADDWHAPAVPQPASPSTAPPPRPRGPAAADSGLPEHDLRDMRLSPPPAADAPTSPAPPARQSPPTPSELAASFAAPISPAPPERAAPAPAPEALFADAVDTVTAEEFEAAARDMADDDADEKAPTPSRFIGPMPDWARTPTSNKRSSKRSKSKLPPDSALAQEHQARHARRKRRKPEFVRQAERAALWRRPMVRAVLATASLALAALLAGQVGYHYREPLAAQVPSLTPVLLVGCEWLQCQIGAPRAIERIRLDASDLTRTEQDQVLRFTADLHNTAQFAVRTPALDVSFTDPLGRVVSRKVLLPKDLGAPHEAIAPDAQWRIDARLAVGDLQVAGYTVEVFYP